MCIAIFYLTKSLHIFVFADFLFFLVLSNKIVILFPLTDYLSLIYFFVFLFASQFNFLKPQMLVFFFVFLSMYKLIKYNNHFGSVFLSPFSHNHHIFLCLFFSPSLFSTMIILLIYANKLVLIRFVCRYSI